MSLLVGRSGEQEVIADALRGAVAGRPSVVWVEGDAGLGKTALVRAAVSRAPLDLQVLQTHADELATDVPFELAGRMGAPTADSSFAAGLQLLDVWSRHQDDGPVAVVVEDLHWADTASSKALLSAAQRLDEDRVVLIITARPGVADGWDRLQFDPERCRRIVLSALTAEDVAALAASEGVDLTPGQAERLHRHTRGHPLYVRTLLSELTPAQLRAADGDLPAPSTLTSAVIARLSEVNEPARRMAAALAVVNQRADLLPIGRMAGVEAPVEPVEQLLGTGFVTWSPDEPGTPLEFVHPLYRQAIYGDLSPRTRRDLHRAVAATLASPAAALAHRVAAADGTDDELADELAASAHLDGDQASMSLAARTLLSSSSLTSDPARAGERLVNAAVAFVDSGQASRAHTLRPRIEGSDASSRRDLALGLLDWDAGRAGEAQAWLEGVVDPNRTPADRWAAARAWAELAEIHWTAGRTQAAFEAAVQAHASSTPDTPTERLAWIYLAMVEAQLRGSPAGLERLEQRLADPPDEVRTGDADMLVARASLSLYSGRTLSALADLRGVLALSRRGVTPVQIARCHFELATVFVSTGAWDEALLHARIGVGIATDQGQPSMQAPCHAVLATVLAYRGDWAAAESALAQATAEAALRGNLEAVGHTKLAAGALGEARHDPVAVISSLQPLRASAPMVGRLAFWPPLVVALIDADQLEEAAEGIEGLASAALARGLEFTARLIGLRARLAAAQGRFEEAGELFQAALDGYGPDDPVMERTQLLYASGRALLAAGHPTRAAGPLRKAREAFAALGAAPFVDRVDLDLGAVGALGEEGPMPARSSLDLTDRERDVAVLVSQGFTNPEVAEQLYVSRKAVEYHLSNIFGKLGMTSRRQLRGLTF